MVEDDVEDYGQSLVVSGVNEFAQLVIRGSGILGETRIGCEEVDDAVTVVAVRVVHRVTGVSEDRAEPDGAESQILNVAQLRLGPAEGAALVIIVGGVVPRAMPTTASRYDPQTGPPSGSRSGNHANPPVWRLLASPGSAPMTSRSTSGSYKVIGIEASLSDCYSSCGLSRRSLPHLVLESKIRGLMGFNER